MQTLKSLLETLLSLFAKKTDLADYVKSTSTDWAVAQFPPAGERRITQTISEASGSITPTYDGWLCLQANCTRLRIQTQYCSFVIPVDTKGFVAATLPVRKGWGIDYELEDATPLSAITCVLVPSVGAK